MTTKSSLEDEVWGQEVAYWEYVKAADLDSYLSLWHEEAVGWPNNQLTPMNRSNIYQLVDGALAALDLATYKVELKRMSVHVVGSIGITFYETYTQATMKTGAEISTRERMTHTWLRTRNGWKIIGGMSAPLTHP
jgi:ketosteroid isomerase-like protein